MPMSSFTWTKPGMNDRLLTPAGRHWLGRRNFLSQMAGGMSGIALTALLAEQGLLAGNNNKPTAPDIRPDVLLAAQLPHFPAKAKRVLHVFCTGAVSHLDTWDYKPELAKWHGQPMPGIDKLVTFQGENGNVTRSPWKFRPHGQTGKYVSDLLPHLAECIDDMCFVH